MSRTPFDVKMDKFVELVNHQQLKRKTNPDFEVFEVAVEVEQVVEQEEVSLQQKDHRCVCEKYKEYRFLLLLL
jgi:hypothetical protein